MSPFASRLALVVALLITAGAAPAFAQPTNDDFANAVVVDPATLPTTVTGTSAGATGEPGEPGGNGALNTVWWRITPAADGALTVDTFGSGDTFGPGFDTVLTIFTGASVDGLTVVTSNDDSGSLQSQVTFTATASTTYYIQVDGYAADTGAITLNTDFTPPPPPPPNDDFANAAVLDPSTLPSTTTGTNADASGETGETGGDGALNTVWWRITPAADGDLTVDTFGSGFDTVLSIFTGTSVDNLTLVADDDDSGGGVQSEVTFAATASTTYYIQVDGFGPLTGAITLNASFVPAPPPNDAFADATAIDPATLPATVIGTNVAATGESSEPGGNGALNTVWWRITPAADGALTVDTFGSGFDTVLSIFTGTSVDDLTALTANDNAGGGSQSEVTFAAAASTTYYIQVDGAGMGTGNITLNTMLGPQITDVAPATVRPGDAIRITGTNFPDSPSVTIGGISATVTSASSTEVVATVPDGSTGGTVEIGVADSPEPLRVHDAPYGPETALAFDGDGDELDAGTGIRLDNRSFSIDFWAKRAATGLLHYVIGQGTAQTTNQSLHVGFEDNDQFAFAFYGNDLKAPAFASTDWHHWTVTYDHATGARTIYRDGTSVASDNIDPATAAYAGTGDLRIGRVAFQNDWHFNGDLDQVRIWNRSLSEAEIRERMHRTIAPTDAAFGDLIASYRFDAGSGTTAYDYAGASTASFQGDPQWTAFSAVPVGQQSARATPGTDALVGPTGARLLVSGVSADAVQLYRYGQSDGPVRDGSAPGDRVTGLRSNLTWGLATPSTAAPTADLTIEYSSVVGLGLSDASVDPVLLVRPGPGTPWQTASGWTHDAASQTFTFSGSVSPGEYALGRAAILYVDGTAGDDANPGTSWSQPFATLTKALATASSNDEIWIAEGTYTPTSGTDRTASFTVTGEQDGLRIYGGFENGDTTRSDRNPADHPVVLSGDIDGDGTFSGNSYHVLVVDGGDALGATVDANVTPATVLSGVLITGGNADGSAPNDDGGGLYCDGQGPGNTCSPTLTGVVFSGNSADDAGGAIVNRGREGASRPRITNAIFTGNSAASGGAMFNDGSDGGASSALMTNVTFAENSAIEGGAIYNFGSTGTSAPALTNTILWSNTASNDGNHVFNTDAAPTFAHSLVQGSGGSASWNASLGTDAGGNLDADPLFADANAPAGSDGVFGTADDGLRLTSDSPAIARGTYAPFEAGGLAESVTTDLAGDARRFGLFPDLGAYELNTIAATSDQISDAGGLLGYVEPSGFEGRLLLRENTAGSGSLTFTRTDEAPDDLSGELLGNVAPVTWTITSTLTPAPTYDLMLEVSSLPGIGDFSALMLYKSADGGQTWDAVTDLGGTLVLDEGRALVAVQDLEGFSQFAIASTDPSNPLPVELAGFEAQRAGEDAITVQWQTLSETNNAGFEVQRRAAPNVETSHQGVSTTGAPAGASWPTIARLEGAGTTDVTQSYQFEDTDLPYAADSLSYRLRQVDTDGTESFSEAVTIARPVPGAELLPTYPNPARGQATVRFAVPERQDVRIVLYDLLGRRVQTVVDAEAEGRTEQPIDVSRLASGTYFLRMQTDGHTETQRLTVVR